MASGKQQFLSENIEETLAEYKVDLICGGFPCQPVSYAGNSQYQNDPRWLWPQFFATIRLLRPRYVLIENVPGLLICGIQDILRDLASIGYDAQWDVVSARELGAHHIRQRVFVVAYTRCQFSAFRIPNRNVPQCSEWDYCQEIGGENRFISKVGTKIDPILGEKAKLPESELLRMVDGIPTVLDRLKALGNAVVPQVAEWIGRRIEIFERMNK